MILAGNQSSRNLIPLLKQPGGGTAKGFRPRPGSRKYMKGLITKKKASKIIDNFSGTNVMVVGDVMVDHFIWGKVSRISPEAPVPVVEVARESQMLGGSANVL